MTNEQFKWKYRSNDRLIDFICNNKLKYYLEIGEEIITLPKSHRSIFEIIKNKFRSKISKKEINIIQHYIFILYTNNNIPFECLLKRKRQLTRYNNLFSILETVVVSIVSSFIIYYLYDTDMLTNFANSCSNFFQCLFTKVPELYFKDVFPFLEIILKCIILLLGLLVLIISLPIILIYSISFVKQYNIDSIFSEYELNLINKKIKDDYNL